jgi:membrane-associated phospholipid phosphatase
MRKVLILPALLLTLAATPAAALSSNPYITAHQADLVDLLPPPAPNSAPHGPGSPRLPAETRSYATYSDPSGHSAFGAMAAILLTGMVPEKRAELFARGWEFGRNRVVGGVHFPSDVAAGRIEATAMVAIMFQNPVFKRDFTEAKAELRRILNLPDLPANIP